MFKKLFATSTLLLSTSMASAYSNCTNMPMRSISKSAMTAIASNICALDAIRENERLPLTIKTTSTYFHEFQVNADQERITAEGVCSKAVDYSGRTLSEGIPFKISISFDDWKNKRNPIFKGTMGKDSHIGRQTLALKFNDSSYLNQNCGYSSYSDRTLSQIALGEGALDILRRGRSNITATAIEQEWDGIPSSKAIRLDFQVTEFSGRRQRLVTSYDSGLNFLVKSGNYLFKEEGAPEFDYDYKKANNLFLRDHGKFIGCSKFQQNGELDIPDMMDSYGCYSMRIRGDKFTTLNK